MHNISQPVKVELLAPARNADIAIEAIRHGADAVYMGASSHGARHAAANSIDDIKRVVEYAHTFNAKVYVTVNTLVYDNELNDVADLISALYNIGVDALIVQDLGILKLDIPPIALHASTQCDIRTPVKAKFLQDAGFSQLVLPRELTLDEIRAMRKTVDIPLEAFIHGALCVSYSGYCRASFTMTGRSANRGECAQICRLPFDLCNGKGECLIKRKHLLSLKDMSRIDILQDMLNAGITSFKIEGRLKDIDYVKNVVAAYSVALDSAISETPGKFIRASKGRVIYNFEPDIYKSFNRGFTQYLFGNGESKIASVDTPKWIGLPIGIVKEVSGTRLIVALRRGITLANGDGLGFFSNDTRQFEGFRVNRVERDSVIYTVAQIKGLKRGTELFRNADMAWNKMIEGPTAQRFIDVNVTLRPVANGIAADATDESGQILASACIDGDFEPARTSQQDRHKQEMSKLGGTSYRLSEFVNQASHLFIPASRLSELKRQLVDALCMAHAASYQFDYRRQATPGLHADGFEIDNIANKQASQFYRSVTSPDTQRSIAIEVGKKIHGKVRVMTTRYCLRREYGKCLRTAAGRQWDEPLCLKTDNGQQLDLQFDCARCQMHIYRDL